MPRLRGHYTIEPDGHRTRVICETEIDFGGNVPGFLVRSTLPEQMRGVVDDLRQEIATTLASS
jgi:F420-0:gamma-glutamyl ligase-like protein